MVGSWYRLEEHAEQLTLNDPTLCVLLSLMGVVISMLCCGPSEVVVANEVLDGTNVIGQLLGEG